jgi:hypothetical protein
MISTSMRAAARAFAQLRRRGRRPRRLPLTRPHSPRSIKPPIPAHTLLVPAPPQQSSRSRASLFLLALLSLPSSIEAVICVGSRYSSSPDVMTCTKITGNLIVRRLCRPLPRIWQESGARERPRVLPPTSGSPSCGLVAASTAAAPAPPPPRFTPTPSSTSARVLAQTRFVLVRSLVLF